ncbi:MAG TPA: glycosyltransferase [Candidatus Eremiobacteraceae bacterium]|nr:glycosyltransferase [Candidatus Eremiobacteraceae bacterium]
MKLSVVVPTYNRVDTLREVLPSLLGQTLPAREYEIIVADSRSADGTAELIARLAQAAGAPALRHLPGDYAGRASARNAGIAAASAPLVLFTDADIIASPDLLERHVADHGAAAHRVAVVGCELQVNSLADYQTQRDHPEVRKPLHPASKRRLSWLYFLTGNASVRRDDLLAVGAFDEDFTGYGHEDLELGYRLQKAGVELRYDPDAINYHWHPVGYQEQKSKMELAGVSTVRFYRKHRDVAVMANLGMTPLSLALHSLLQAAGPVRRAIERAAEGQEAPRKNTWPFIARQIAYQYHYLNGVKRALREPDGARRT